MKKFLIVILCILVIAVISIGVIVYKTNQTEPSLCLKEYFEKLNNKEYDEMYDYVKTNTSKEEFVTRIKNIYEGIEANNINTTVVSNIEDEDNSSIINVTYNNSMDTIAGNMNFLNTVKLQKSDDGYKILWNSSVIFPDLKDEYKVRVSTLDSTRGAIYDRNDIAIAKDGTAYYVGLVPGKMDDTTDLAKLSELLGITEDTIKNSLNEEYVKEDTFVPLRKISKDEQDLKNELLTIKGILIQDVSARIYPYKEATSILTGYVQDGVGKTGLEYAYNDRLKGEDGAEIYIADEKGAKTKTLAINSSIQASKSGEWYNNFSVVSKEVSELVTETAQATSRMQNLLFKIEDIFKKFNYSKNNINNNISSLIEEISSYYGKLNRFNRGMEKQNDYNMNIIKSTEKMYSSISNMTNIIVNEENDFINIKNKIEEINNYIESISEKASIQNLEVKNLMRDMNKLLATSDDLESVTNKLNEEITKFLEYADDLESKVDEYSKVI